MPPHSEDDVLDRLSRVAQAQRSALAALARNEGLTPEDAVDCVQEGLCTVVDLVQTGQLDVAADLAPVVATVVRNTARNHRRRHFRARPHEPFETHEQADDHLLFQDDLLARAEEKVRLRACVAELCEIQRAVVTLRMLEERPGEDVAALLGITKNHAAVLLHRAKSSLRACMMAPTDTDGP
ncbi:MAG TPA: sigma-70 family RNA polymerase sigma factor [Polyangiaceae bacterium]|jgi:RNA polymerase sigma-70 factor (ECF subfamily)|nr:sigma-70 family RNA polymerase sigma factor [Polyangiaceae bacterium]